MAHVFAGCRRQRHAGPLAGGSSLRRRNQEAWWAHAVENLVLKEVAVLVPGTFGDKRR